MKIEQIAFGAKDPIKIIELFKTTLGLTDWIEDEVSADGIVDGRAANNIAKLYFNYQWGIELEILRYSSGANWHQFRNPLDLPIFASHMGYHCTEEQAQEKIVQMYTCGINVIQEVYTYKHTNPVIAGKRLYHYIVFDSLSLLGFDLKLIVRQNT